MGGKAAIIVVVGFSIILGFVVRSLSNVSTRAQTNMSTYAASTESHNLAITGANVGLTQLYQDTSWRGTYTQDLSKAFSGAFTYTVEDGANGRPVLHSVSWVRGPEEILRDTVIVTFGSKMIQSFTLYAWMTNVESNIWFVTGDTIWGPIHANDNIRCKGTPTFMGKVTTAKGLSPAPGSGGNDAVFKNGYETGVAPVTFPKDLSAIAEAAASGGRCYTGNIEVTLRPGASDDNDGYALVYSGGVRIDSITINNGLFNGVLGSTGVVSVSGTLDGRLSIFSIAGISIVDDLLYQDRSQTSNDVLGLVADKYVTIADNVPNSTDVIIDASIFVRSGDFGAENYQSSGIRGRACVIGSIVQATRGAVGTFASNGTLKSGYLKSYRYDERLADPNFRPPFYPGFYKESFPIASWWESVRIPKYY